MIELVRKCEELYEMSTKKCRDNVWREKLRGQVGEELKISGKFQCVFVYFEFTLILLSPRF
jgi:hypothetical protein